MPGWSNTTPVLAPVVEEKEERRPFFRTHISAAVGGYQYAQEPGTDSEIKEFCSSKFGVKFDMLSKVSVKGKDICPLYKHLTANSSPAGDVAWNFEKYLVGKDGTILGHYKSAVKPDSPELVKAIEAALAK